MSLALLAAVAYLLGAIPFGVLVARARGVDILKAGSGNIGATNVGRVLGKGPGIAVWILDVLKSLAPTLVARGLLHAPLGGLDPQTQWFLVGTAAILGHCASPFLRFRGGKGISTALGAIVGTAPLVALLCFGLFALVLATVRYMAIASTVGVASVVLFAALFGVTPQLLPVFAALALFVAYRHRSNFGRLRAGTEPRFSLKKAGAPPDGPNPYPLSVVQGGPMSTDVLPKEPPKPGDPAPRRAVLIVNTKSRRGQEWFQRAQDELKGHGIEVEKASNFEEIEDLMAAAKEAIGRKVPLIVAGGGDGTFNALSDLFVDSESVLGLLPLGTGNSLARDLGIQADVKQACEVIAKGKIQEIDLGYVNGTHFVNVATIGLTTKIAQNLTNDLKKRLGRFVYAVAIWRAMRTSRAFRAVLETEGGRKEFDCLQFVIGNGRFHAGPFPIAPDASITSGALNVYAVEGRSKWALVKYALSLPGGHFTALAEVLSVKCDHGTLTTTPSKQVTVDGEICTQTPLEFRSVPKGMRVVVPADWNG